MCNARVLLAFLRIVDTNSLRPRQVEFLSSSRKGGYLTPFKVLQLQTTLDTYVYTADDDVEEGEIEQGRRYVESDFNRIIEIKEREQHRVGVFMTNVNQAEKAIVFCATQDQDEVRDLLSVLAQQNGQSLEDTVREILRAAVAERGAKPVALGTKIGSRFVRPSGCARARHRAPRHALETALRGFTPRRHQGPRRR